MGRLAFVEVIDEHERRRRFWVSDFLAIVACLRARKTSAVSQHDDAVADVWRRVDLDKKRCDCLRTN